MLELCFKDIVATGYGAWAPYKDPNLYGEDNDDNNNDNDENIAFITGGDMSYSTQAIREDIDNYTIVQSPTNRQKRKKTTGGKVERRAEVATRLQDSLDRIVVVWSHKLTWLQQKHMILVQ